MGLRPRTIPRHFVFAAAMVLAASAAAQRNPDPPVPYAAIDHRRIDYSGPDRTSSRDLNGPEVKIGLLLPLGGPRRAEGESSLLAARLALEDLDRQHSAGRRLALVLGDESGPWGRASSEVVRLIVNEDAAAVVTSSEGKAAHLAEQIGNKIGVPVLTLATDSTITEINLPWIFRLSPDDRVQAELFARVIYRERGYRKIVLITELDHDGREGAAEFEKSAAKLGAPPPERLELDAATLDLPGVLSAIQLRTPEAVVIWTDAAIAREVAPALGQAGVPVFLPQKAMAEGTGINTESLWTLSRLGADVTARRSFDQRFQSRVGRLPGIEAETTYDAIMLVGSALRVSGPNRARLRDQLAKTNGFAGVSGEVSFDGAGNNVVPVRLTRAAELGAEMTLPSHKTSP